MQALTKGEVEHEESGAEQDALVPVSQGKDARRGHPRRRQLRSTKPMCLSQTQQTHVYSRRKSALCSKAKQPKRRNQATLQQHASYAEFRIAKAAQQHNHTPPLTC
jgi:hypothetical protein